MPEAIDDATSVRCSLCGHPIPRVPADGSDPESTLYGRLAGRYRGFFSAAARVAICLRCDGGDRVCPHSGTELEPLREAHLGQVRPQEVGAEDTPEYSPAVAAFLDRLWAVEAPQGVAGILDQASPDVVTKACEELDLEALPVNPAVTARYNRGGQDNRFAMVVNLAIALHEHHADWPATETLWQKLLRRCRRRLLMPKDPKAPLDDALDPEYLVGPNRQYLVQGGNHLLRARRATEAKVCFEAVLGANPDLAEVHYAHAIACNNRVAQPRASSGDRLAALRAFDAFLECPGHDTDEKRLRTIRFLRRQILGLKDHPKP